MGTVDSFFSGPFIAQTLVTAVLSGSIVGIILKMFIDRRLERLRVTREWQERVLSTVVGPIVMHLDRTAKVAARYQKTFNQHTTSYFDAQLMHESNLQLRTILLTNGHLLPATLRPHAHRLVAHYDVWLARFDAKVVLETPTAESMFDIGFVDPRFPVEASAAFLAEFDELREHLYGIRTLVAEATGEEITRSTSSVAGKHDA